MEFQSPETTPPEEFYSGGGLWQGPNLAAHIYATELSQQSAKRIVPEYSGRFGITENIDGGLVLWGSPVGFFNASGDYGLQGDLKVMLTPRTSTFKAALDFAPFVYGGSWIPIGDTTFVMLSEDSIREVRAWGFVTGVKGSLHFSLDLDSNLRLYGSTGLRLISGSFSYAHMFSKTPPFLNPGKGFDEVPFFKRKSFSRPLFSLSGGIQLPKIGEGTQLFIEAGLSQIISDDTMESATGFYVGFAFSTKQKEEEKEL